MKPCIVCQGTGKYRYSNNAPGRQRIRGHGWRGPCRYCNGTGEVEIMARPTAAKGYLAIGPGQVFIMAPEPWLVNGAALNAAIALAKALTSEASVTP